MTQDVAPVHTIHTDDPHLGGVRPFWLTCGDDEFARIEIDVDTDPDGPHRWAVEQMNRHVEEAHGDT